MKVPPGLKKMGLIPNLPYTGWGHLTKNKAIFSIGGGNHGKNQT